MCQHSQRLESGVRVVWGYDYPLAHYFYDVYMEDGEHDPTASSWGCDNQELVEFFDQHGVIVPPRQLDNIICDLPCCPRGNAGKTPEMLAALHAIGIDAH